MERIQPRRYTGLSASGIRIWGMLFVALGAVGRAVIQNGIMGMAQGTGEQLLALLESDPSMMVYATVAVVLQALSACAVPVFAFLLAEGMKHTSDRRAYLLRLIALAAVAEIPYNLMTGQTLLDFSGRNPAFGLVFGQIAIWFCIYYEGRTAKNLLLKVLVILCALLWCGMLNVEFGGSTVVIALVLWFFRGKPSYRNIAGAIATIVCSLGSMFFMAAPLGFLAVFLYNGEEGDTGRAVRYGAYPAILLMAALVGLYI